MIRQRTRHHSGTQVMMRQWTGCGHASGHSVLPSGQKTGMHIPWHFFVHSIALTRINTRLFGVDNPVHCEHSCPHFCGQDVDTRVDILCPGNIHRKGECVWRPVP